MSTKPQISIIIPTYNLENYIGSTLESVLLQQTLPKNDLEIIVIDDGSTDRTTAIVKAYAKKHPNIKLINNERTKGVSGARNTGISYAQGENCFFLDGDDLLPKNALSALLSCIEKHKTPIVKGQISYICHQRWIYIKPKHTKNNANNSFIYPSGSFAQHLYNTSFLKENKILFPEEYSVGEDRAFFCHAFCKTLEIPSTDDIVYIYRINHKKNRSSAEHAISFIKHFEYIRRCFEDSGKMGYYFSYLQSQFSELWIHYAYYILKEKPQVIESYLDTCINILINSQLNEEKTHQILASDLNESTSAFLTACKVNDKNSMLKILEKKTFSITPSSYIGIKESRVQKHWELMRILHRAKNIVLNPKNISHLYYIYKLWKKAEKHNGKSSKQI